MRIGVESSTDWLVGRSIIYPLGSKFRHLSMNDDWETISSRLRVVDNLLE